MSKDSAASAQERRFPGSAASAVFVRHVGKALVTLLILSALTFVAMNMRSPADVARQKLGRDATAEQLSVFVDRYELDRPIHERYPIWLWRFMGGDMGSSHVTERSIGPDIAPRFQRTVILTVAAVLVALPLSLLIGVFQARSYGKAPDLAVLTSSIVVAALPEFVLAVVLLMVFSVWWGLLPVESGTALTFASSFVDQAKAYILPAFTLIIAMTAYTSRIARASIREALAAPYAQAAVLRGLPRRMVIWDHVMRNAAVPIVNAVAIGIVYLLGGVIVIENVFAFPGIGQGLVQAISTTDTNTVQAIVLVMGALFIVISLLADLLVVYLNPRLRQR
jgi:peptide/nickel transport system permease protein